MNIFKIQLSHGRIITSLLGWLCAVGVMTYQIDQSQRSWAQEVSKTVVAKPKTQKSTRPTAAMEAEATKRINRLSDELKSPFCPGKTLLTCTSPEAFKLRREMRQMILEGHDDLAILKVIRDSFDEPLENPPQPWITVFVPVLPFIFGLIIALWMFIHWRRNSSNAVFNNDDDATVINPQHKYYDRLQDLLDDEE